MGISSFVSFLIILFGHPTLAFLKFPAGSGNGKGICNRMVAVTVMKPTDSALLLPKGTHTSLCTSSRDNDADAYTSLMRVLPLLSFALSVTGVCFQVFVLYPWHEELSYEFKSLETAIIKLDQTLEGLDPDVKDMALQRMTDKYTLKPNARWAGPRISNFLPVIPKEELDEMHETK